jgi:general secretion pathway protein C
MNLTIDPRVARFWRQVPPKLPYQILEFSLIALLAVQGARLIWAVLSPVGPVGAWKASSGAGPGGDETLLTRFDPFFRLSGAGGPAVVTSLAVKLFGVRVDQAMGRGSAIIATPDGVQSSYAIGDEILPGVKLKAVTFEGVTIERGGVDEQIFLDQSVKAPLAQPGTAPVAAAAPPVAGGAALASEIGFMPRSEKGQVTGFVVSPKGSGTAFRAAGLQEGDVLTAINGQTIRAADDVTRAMAASPASGIVMLSVERGGKAISLSAKAKP